MGSVRKSIEALIVRHVLLNGEDEGDWIVLEISRPYLAELLGVDYSALYRITKNSDLLKYEAEKVWVKKVGTIS